jgi:hypothetical protein
MVSLARRKLQSDDHTDRLFGLCLLAEALNADGVSELLRVTAMDVHQDVREMAGKMLDVIERSRKQRKADRSQQ